MAGYDVIFVLPYPFADHPSFPEGILKRTLESGGYRVGVIEAPFWQKKESFTTLGKPRLFFAVITGPVDSVVLNYTSSRKRRMEDQYQMRGEGFFPGHPPSIKYRIRPDNAAVVFSNRLKECYRDVPIVIGGVEASLRQFAHYDFQKDRIRRSILFDSRADLLVSGPGERQILAVASGLNQGDTPAQIQIPGISKIEKEPPPGAFILPSLEEILEKPVKLLEAALGEERGKRKVLGQKNGDRYVVRYPADSLTASDLDRIYSHPYTRRHPGNKEYSPALSMNLFSITSHRGCGGGCSFCSISLLEGKQVISRSPESILGEIRDLSRHPRWKGIISDIGGPSAEMYGFGCGVPDCVKSSCLHPGVCPSLKTGSGYRDLLKRVRSEPGIRQVFVGSGLRFDQLSKNPDLLEDILRFHTGKFLRIAPEHTEPHILKLMRKPPFSALKEFMEPFRRITRTLRREISAAPYLIVGHPGETFPDVRAMKEKLKSLGLKTTDVQIFTPTPGTLSTAMYYSETDLQGNSIPVEKNIKELIRRKNLMASG